MAVAPPKAMKSPKIQTVNNNAWIKGVMTAYDSGRVPDDGLISANNCILTQDGTVRPRPSLQKWGPQPTGVILGEMYPFRHVDNGTFTNWLITVQKVPQNEVQTIAITGSPTGGTFTLTYSGQTTSAIAYNASDSDIQSALEALSNIEVGDVTCAGGALPATAVTVTFNGSLANTNVGAITATPSLTGGSAPNVAITETDKGGDHAYAYIAKPEDSSWTKCIGNNFDTSVKAHFKQHGNKVVILNGEDHISYLDISTVDTTPTLTKFSALADATAPTLTATGLTGSNYTIRYAVTANSSVGETTGVEKSQAISIDRDLWDSSSQKIVISWSAVTDAKSYNLYCAISADGDNNPVWGLLASGISADTTTFTDKGGGKDGSGPINTYKSLPKQNSTAGPKASRAEVINGQLWLTGDKDNPYYVWHDGGTLFQLDFTVANGGGFVEIGGGGREVPVKVFNFRSGPGDPQIKVLTKGINSVGKRYTITPQTITYGGASATIWVPTEDYGYSGTDSPDALIVEGNSAYYPSLKDFRSLGTKPQLQNLISNDSVAQTLSPEDLSVINNNAMDGCVGVAYESRLYWSLPVAADHNNQIWVLDLLRGGAWMKPWTVSADWMVVVADNNGYSHHVVISNNTIYEFSYATHTSDDGVAFPTSGATGFIKFSKDGRQWGRLIKAVVENLRAQGNIDFKLNGLTNSGEVEVLASYRLSENTSTNGYGWGEAGWGDFGWGDMSYVPELTGKSTSDAPLKVNKDLRYWSVSWSTTEANVDYSISNMTALFVNVGYKNLR